MRALKTHELRQSPRFSITVKYNLIIGDSQLYTGETGNISINGAYLATVQPELTEINPEDLASLILQLDTHTITLSCRIVYINNSNNAMPIGLGVSFNEHQNKALSHLISCLESNQK